MQHGVGQGLGVGQGALRLHHAPVASTRLHQLAMGPQLGNAARLHHH